MLLKTVAVLGGVAAAFLPPGVAEIRTTTSPHHYYETSMTTAELEAFREVSRQCQDDVERLCDQTFFFPHPFLRMDTHPMLRSMMMAPPPPPPPQPALLHLDHDLGSFIDNFMMSAIQGSFANQGNDGNFVLVMSTADNDDNEEPCDQHMTQLQDETMEFSLPHDDRLVHHVLRHFVSPETTPEEGEEVLERVSDHAHSWVDRPDTSEPQRRMARRLTEVSTDDIRMAQAYSAATHSEESFLPFTPAHNLCLRQAFHHNTIHPTCHAAIARLEIVRASQHMMLVYKQEAEQTMLSHLALLYFFVIATAIVLFIRRSKDIRKNRRLRFQVLKAIYSKPHLKRAVESEIGKSIGSVPPLQWPDVMHIGLHGKNFGRLLRLSKMIRLSLLTVMCVLLFVAPAAVLPFCIILAAVLFWSALWAPKPVRMCCCCNCGLSTEDVKAGRVTSEQACCSCCCGTGVCSVHCGQCGGPNNDEKQDGGCCKNDCCCAADNKDCCTIETGYVKMEDKVDGSCCCCAESDCCGGMKCGCCCCCTSTCSCDPDKCDCGAHHKQNKSRLVMTARASVYEGIPVQIV